MALLRRCQACLVGHSNALAYLCATIALVTGGLAAYATEAGTACFIEARSHSGGMLTLEAMLEAGATGLDGSFRLTIETTGSAGQSRSVQAGDVHLAPGERRGLGTVAIDAQGMQVVALLTVVSVTGADCTARF